MADTILKGPQECLLDAPSTWDMHQEDTVGPASCDHGRPRESPSTLGSQSRRRFFWQRISQKSASISGDYAVHIGTQHKFMFSFLGGQKHLMSNSWLFPVAVANPMIKISLRKKGNLGLMGPGG